MFKKIISITFIASFIITSCADKSEKKEGGDDEKSKEESVIIKSPQATDIIPNMLADISLSGVVCEIKCVESVKTLLSNMIGVTEIEIDYNADGQLNHATLKFDDKKISDEQMVSALENFKNGAFKVEKIDIKKLDEKTARKKSKEEKDLTKSYSSSGSSDFALPSILDVFSTVL